MWEYRGQKRPDFAISPGHGQESVWDYHRPPRMEPDKRLVEVKFQEKIIASSTRTIRILETASPPTFYIPPLEVNWEMLRPAPRNTMCEWKGRAEYWQIPDNPDLGVVAWSYPIPTTEFTEIQEYISFYPGKLACFVDRERVLPQPGDFYGGWITSEIVGPFKGEPGSENW